MGIRDPLGYGATHARNDPDVGAESTAAHDQGPMAEGILDPLEDTADFPHIRLGNARPGNRHVDDLGNREQAQRRGHQPNSVPEIESPEGISFGAGNGIEPHQSKQEPEACCDEPLHYRSAGQGSQERDAQHGEHEILGRTYG